MRSSAILDLAHTARTLSQRRLVRVQLRKEVPGLGSAGSSVLVQPGRMRNELFPQRKAIYHPLPTPFQLSLTKSSSAAAEAQRESQQAQLDLRKAREALSKELGAIQLLSLRRKLEAVPTIVLSRSTTTKYRPAANASAGSSSADADLPRPALTIQGSIATDDIVAFLRQNGAFDLETDFSQPGKPAQLNRLTASQINTTCEFSLVSAQSTPDADAIDKLGRIKKTGRYTLVAHIVPSNIRVRIPVTVRPNAASTSSAAVAAATVAASSSAPSASMASQTRSYATSAKQPTGMEQAMRTKLEAEFGPQVEVNIRNDSSKHAHHAAMAAQGGGNGETHFYVHIVSDKFAGMPQIKRHRAVNALLAAEFERGLHALSLRTKTWAEENRQPAAAVGHEQAANNIGDGSDCPRTAEDAAAGGANGGSLWTAPESSLHPTSPLAAQDILAAFYTPPPKQANVSTAGRATAEQRAKFFRRVTKHEAVEPSTRQNQLNVLGALLAGVCATYMVLFADFGQAAAVNCFTDLRLAVWGPQGPPNLF